MRIGRVVGRDLVPLSGTGDRRGMRASGAIYGAKLPRPAWPIEVYGPV